MNKGRDKRHEDARTTAPLEELVERLARQQAEVIAMLAILIGSAPTVDSVQEEVDGKLGQLRQEMENRLENGKIIIDRLSEVVNEFS